VALPCPGYCCSGCCQLPRYLEVLGCHVHILIVFARHIEVEVDTTRIASLLASTIACVLERINLLHDTNQPNPNTKTAINQNSRVRHVYRSDDKQAKRLDTFDEFNGIKPNRCARNSSLRTDVLLSISTRSIANVGTCCIDDIDVISTISIIADGMGVEAWHTSAIMMRRSALAKLVSASRNTNCNRCQ
jgi:hypothetical protein